VFTGISFFVFVETGMNGSSHQNNENPRYCEGSPPQGLSEVWRGKEVSTFFHHLSAAQEVPSGAAEFIPFGGMRVSTLIIIPE